MDVWERIISTSLQSVWARSVKKSEAAESHAKLDLPCSPDLLLGQEEEATQEGE